MGSKPVREIRDFAEWIIELEKSQTQSKGDKTVWEDNSKENQTQRHEKDRGEYGYLIAVFSRKDNQNYQLIHRTNQLTLNFQHFFKDGPAHPNSILILQLQFIFPKQQESNQTQKQKIFFFAHRHPQDMETRNVLNTYHSLCLFIANGTAAKMQRGEMSPLISCLLHGEAACADRGTFWFILIVYHFC